MYWSLQHNMHTAIDRDGIIISPNRVIAVLIKADAITLSQ